MISLSDKKKATQYICHWQNWFSITNKHKY